MKILVCIKQVPGTSNVKVDPVTGVLIRDGVESKMNPFDLFALETALKIKDEETAEITVISMGPPAATAVLKEAIYMGADAGVLISDRKFAGADVLATGRTISSAIKKLGKFDVIFCGKQTTDGDTAQVGSEVAEFLGVPHCANVRNVDFQNGRAHCVCELAETVVTLNMKMPCLICTDADINTPRLPSYKRMQELCEREDLITVLSLADFEDKNPDNYGLSGSPTQVERIFPPDKSKKHEVFDNGDEFAAESLFKLLKSQKYV